ncbi:hypothetical protein [Reinekea thalattae]|uniref:MBL fold metallo-hydrolase n=1 Tax=Reinekea thalattae TaxID=2593301 RepID=A0A5C8Z9J2_9GAMM|nr:hypothetical protein [Reinekea thalattae]TXR53526.1 hypothetical protein FME95_02865 [Reinekea thalattae]
MNMKIKVIFSLIAALLLLVAICFSGVIRFERQTRVLPFEAQKFGDENFIFNAGNYDNAFNDGNLHWVSVNLSGGQYSDAHLITKNTESILIDTGSYQNKKEHSLARYLEENKVSYLSTIYLMSFSPESYGGLRELLLSDDISIGSIKLNMPSNINDTQDRSGGNKQEPLEVLRDIAAYKNLTIDIMMPNERYDIDDDTFIEVLYSHASLPALSDDQSKEPSVPPFVAMLSDYGNRFLITGDNNTALEHYFLSQAYDVDVATIPLSSDKSFVPDAFLDNVVAKDYLAASSVKYWKKLKALQSVLNERSINAYVNGIEGHIAVISNQDGYTIRTTSMSQ